MSITSFPIKLWMGTQALLFSTFDIHSLESAVDLHIYCMTNFIALASLCS